MSVSPDHFRTALRQWPSGVSVVTSFSTEPVGLTVSAFFSVSLVPPLVGVCLDRQSATLPVILATARTETSLGGTDWGMLQAGITISIIPCVLVYLLLQRYYVSGLMTGAVK